MPQITCPNCGTTINLENRKEIDINLIKDAAKKNPMTFTELLHVTKLPRKTLNLRLKELCSNGTIVKAEGTYRLNGTSGHGIDFPKTSFRFSRARVLALLALLVFSSTGGYVLALLLAPQPVQVPIEEPLVLGSFTMTLDVNNVADLYAWQAAITYNETELKVKNVSPGEFLGVDFPLFVNATDVHENLLELGGTLTGDESGRSGSGTLATIVFDYYIAQYEVPKIDFESQYITPFWRNSQLIETPFDTSNLALTVVGN